MLSPLRNGGIVLGVSWSECKYLSFPAEEPSEVLQVWLSLAQCHYSPPSRETGVGGLENLRRWSRAFGSLKRLGSVSERANVTFYVTKSAFCSHPCFGTWPFHRSMCSTLPGGSFLWPWATGQHSLATGLKLRVNQRSSWLYLEALFRV